MVEPNAILFNFIESTEIVTAFKLVRKLTDGYHPIRINKEVVLPVGEWINAKDFQPAKNIPVPGWFCFEKADPYYLTKKDSVFVEVQLQYTRRRKGHGPERPDWIIGQMMRIIKEVK